MQLTRRSFLPILPLTLYAQTPRTALREWFEQVNGPHPEKFYHNMETQLEKKRVHDQQALRKELKEMTSPALQISKLLEKGRGEMLPYQEFGLNVRIYRKKFSESHSIYACGLYLPEQLKYLDDEFTEKHNPQSGSRYVHCVQRNDPARTMVTDRESLFEIKNNKIPAAFFRYSASEKFAASNTLLADYEPSQYYSVPQHGHPRFPMWIITALTLENLKDFRADLEQLAKR